MPKSPQGRQCCPLQPHLAQAYVLLTFLSTLHLCLEYLHPPLSPNTPTPACSTFSQAFPITQSVLPSPMSIMDYIILL